MNNLMEENNNPQEDDQNLVMYNLIIHFQYFMYKRFYVLNFIPEYFKIYDIYLYHHLLN